MAGATSGRAYVYTLTSNNKHGNRQVQDNNALLCTASGLCGNHVLRCLFLGEAELTPSPHPAQSPCSYSLSSTSTSPAYTMPDDTAVSDVGSDDSNVWFSPSTGTYAVISINAVEMVRHFEDDEALEAARLMQPKSYLICLTHVRGEPGSRSLCAHS